MNSEDTANNSYQPIAVQMEEDVTMMDTEVHFIFQLVLFKLIFIFAL